MTAHTIRTAAIHSILLAACCLLWTCNSIIYDYEGDCTVHYLVRFNYDYNMKYADAFAHEVDAVTLYLIDSSGNIVWQKTERGTKVAHTGYTMEVDATPGRYTLMAWCEKESDAPAYHFTTKPFCAALPGGHTDSPAESRTELRNLFYGMAQDVELPAMDEGTFVLEMPLVKDNNHITINLQQLGGKPLQPEEVQMEITDHNAVLGWDNMPTSQSAAIYRPWHMSSITTLPDPATRTEDTYSGVSAEFTTLRLMASHAADSRLRVTNTGTRQTILDLRLIEALLLVKGYYNRQMDDQEYLDRQDAYSLTFFLDARKQWIDSQIIINGWRIVLQNTDLE